MTPLVFLIVLIALNVLVTSATQENLLDNKFEEVKNELGMIAAAVNADPADPWHSHEDNILHFMAFLDAKPLTFAAAYMPEGTDLKLLTERDNATNFDPREFDVFTDAVRENDMGSLVIGFTPTNGGYRDMHLYYMWVPDYSAPHERYLLVAAVSRFSITIKLGRWITIANLAGVIFNFLLCCYNIFYKTSLGHVSGMRLGNVLAAKFRPLDRGD